MVGWDALKKTALPGALGDDNDHDDPARECLVQLLRPRLEIMAYLDSGFVTCKAAAHALV